MNLLFIEDENEKSYFIIENRKAKSQETVGNPATFWKTLQPASDGWVRKQEVT